MLFLPLFQRVRCNGLLIIMRVVVIMNIIKVAKVDLVVIMRVIRLIMTQKKVHILKIVISERYLQNYQMRMVNNLFRNSNKVDFTIAIQVNVIHPFFRII